MIPAISQVCSLHSPFSQDLADYAAATTALATLGANPSAGSYFTPGAEGGFSGAGSSTLFNLNNAIATTGATSMKDMGKVMGAVKAKAAGRADMGAVSASIKAALGG